MGLKIKRFKHKTENWIASHVQKYFTKLTGHDIPFKIDWDSFGDIDDNEDIVKKGLSYSLFESNIKSLCSDELGKDAYKECVQELIVRQTNSENIDEIGYVLEKGALIFVSNQKKRIYGSKKEMEDKLIKLF